MAIVIDTGALIKAPSLASIGAQFHTVQRVLHEVRDKRSRQALAVRLEEIKVSEPTEEDMRYTVDFSKKTGDFSVLSVTDLQVIALACRLERERNGGMALRSEPPVSERREEPRSDDTQNSAEHQYQDLSPTLPIDPPLSESDEETPDAKIESVPVESEEIDDSEEGWITPENYKRPSGPPLDLSDPTTSVITTDFAVQNVVLQMGLKLISLNGRRIRHVKRWVKKCSCCFKLCKETEREFCYYCGGNTLYRVSCEVDEAGNVSYKDAPPRKINLRGTKVSSI